MALVKIFFLILIIICIFFYILYIWDFSLILLVTMCLIPVFMLVSLLITKHSIKAELVTSSKTALKNEPFNVQLKLNNKSFFHIAKAEAYIEYTNLLNGQTNNIELHFPIQARNCQRVTFCLTSKFCGEIDIKINNITLYDPLRMFKFKVGKNTSAEITILPICHDVSASVNESNFNREESPVYSQFHPGDDPSEVFNLREYIGGDKINRIHWKLSIKKDDFIVKEYSQPIDTSTTIFLDFKYSEMSEYTLPILDTLLETMISISQFLVESEKPHTLIQFQPEKNDFEEVIINTPEDFTTAACRYIQNFKLYSSPQASLDTYLKANDTFNYSSFTYITADLNQETLDLIDSSIESEIKNIVAVIKNENDTNVISSDNSTANITVIPAGKISAFLSAIEL